MCTQAVILTTGVINPPITLFSGNPEALRLREVLLSLRPEDGTHDTFCHNGPGQPDTWVDGRDEFEADLACGLRPVEWVHGTGFVALDKPKYEPYVG